MENEHQQSKEHHNNRKSSLIAGSVLVGIGVLAIFSQYLKIGWLPLVALPTAGLVFLVEGVRQRQAGFLIPGSLLLLTGLGAILAFSSLLDLALADQIGLLLFMFGASWGGITLLTLYFSRHTAWWALVPGSVITSAGLCMLFSPMQLLDFVLYIITALGLALLAWGVFARLFGLIIPGSLLTGIGPGIYLAWGKPVEANALAQIGVMLVWFALGWGLIILFSRVITDKFVWWPLIPGGVLAMGGWGLYIGGNPGNATTFITNTGSIGLIIFGLYLLLMRRGIHH